MQKRNTDVETDDTKLRIGIWKDLSDHPKKSCTDLESNEDKMVCFLNLNTLHPSFKTTAPNISSNYGKILSLTYKRYATLKNL